MKPRKKYPSQEYLRSILDYNPETGILTWKKRNEISRHVKRWNTRYAGKPFGEVDGRYIQGSINNIHFYAHRLAWLWMTGDYIKQVDHIDMNKINNRWNNLRAASDNQNKWNRPKQINNTSGYKGVWWDKRREKWVAEIKYKGRKFFLGYFLTPEFAHSAYCEAAKKYHGEFARVA